MNEIIDLLNKQISQIENLKELKSSEDPKFKKWNQVTLAIIKTKLGDEKADDFPSGFHFWPTHMGPWYDDELKSSLISGLDMAEAYLEGLIEEIQLLGINQETSVSTREQQFKNITVSGGTVIFGDGNKVTQVEIKELIKALELEIEENVPESEEKQGVLKALKELTTNETFASVTGAVIGEIFKKVANLG